MAVNKPKRLVDETLVDETLVNEPLVDEPKAEPRKISFAEYVIERQKYFNSCDADGVFRMDVEKHHPDAHMLGKLGPVCNMCDVTQKSFTNGYSSK